jgi:hypothetical protein
LLALSFQEFIRRQGIDNEYLDEVIKSQTRKRKKRDNIDSDNIDYGDDIDESDIIDEDGLSYQNLQLKSKKIFPC